MIMTIITENKKLAIILYISLFEKTFGNLL